MIDGPARANHWLRKISYDGVSAYFLPFNDSNRFRLDTRYDQRGGLYIFDRKLRLLVMDAIERVEVATRASITYEIAHAHGPFGHIDAANFSSEFNHVKIMEELATEERRVRETYVAHFRNKCTKQVRLPIWMATELLLFGAIAMLYKAAHPKIKQRIAADFRVNDQLLASWLHVQSYVHSVVCSHLKRLWNRELAVKPRFSSRSREWLHPVPNNGRLYAVLAVLRHMFGIVSPNCQWRDRLLSVLDRHPTVLLDAMRFPAAWQTLALRH